MTQTKTSQDQKFTLLKKKLCPTKRNQGDISGLSGPVIIRRSGAFCRKGDTQREIELHNEAKMKMQQAEEEREHGHQQRFLN